MYSVIMTLIRIPWIFCIISVTAIGDSRGAVNVYVNTAAVFEKITAENLTKIMRDMNVGV